MKQALAIGFAVLVAATASAAPVRVGSVETELIADVAVLAPGQPFTVGFRMRLDSPWHTYWKNPGDSGLVPSLLWSLPEGFVAGPLQFPTPTAITTPPFMTYALEGEVVFLVSITPPDTLSAGNQILKAEATWLICNDYCVPGSANLELTLPVGDTSVPAEPAWLEPLVSARNQLPVDPVGWRFHAMRHPGRILLYAIPLDPDTPQLDSATFFSDSAELIRHAAPQVWRKDKAGYILELVPSDSSGPPPEHVSGVLVASIPWTSRSSARAFHIELPFSEDAPQPSTPERNLP